MNNIVNYGIQKDINTINITHDSLSLIDPFFHLKKKINKEGKKLGRFFIFNQNKDFLLNLIIRKKTKKPIFKNSQQKNKIRKTLVTVFKKSTNLPVLSFDHSLFYFKNESIKKYLNTSNEPFPIIINKINQNIRKRKQKQKKRLKHSKNFLLLLTTLNLTYQMTYSKNPLLSEINIFKIGNLNLKNDEFKKKKKYLMIILGNNQKIKNVFKLTLQHRFLNKKENFIEEIKKKNLLNQKILVNTFFFNSINIWLFQLKINNLGNLIFFINLSNNWSPHLRLKNQSRKTENLDFIQAKQRLINANWKNLDKAKPLKNFLYEEKKKLYKILWSLLIKRFSKVSILSIANRYWLFLFILKPRLNLYLLDKLVKKIKVFNKKNLENKTQTQTPKTKNPNSKEFLFITYRTLFKLKIKQLFSNFELVEKNKLLTKFKNQIHLTKPINGLTHNQPFQSQISNLNSVKNSKHYIDWSLKKKMSLIQRFTKGLFKSLKIQKSFQDSNDYGDFNIQQKTKNLSFLPIKFKESFFYYTNYQPLTTLSSKKTSLIFIFFKKPINYIVFHKSYLINIFYSVKKNKICYTSREIRSLDNLSIYAPFLFLKKIPISMIDQTFKKPLFKRETSINNLCYYNKTNAITANKKMKSQKQKTKKLILLDNIKMQLKSKINLTPIKWNNPFHIKKSENQNNFLCGVTSYLLTYKKKKSFLKLSFLNLKQNRYLNTFKLKEKSFDDSKKGESLKRKKALLNTKESNDLLLMKKNLKQFLRNKFFPFGFSVSIFHQKTSFIKHYLIYYENRYKKKDFTYLNALLILNKVQTNLDWSLFLNDLNISQEKKSKKHYIKINFDKYYEFEKKIILTIFLYIKELFIQYIHLSIHFNCFLLHKPMGFKSQFHWTTLETFQNYQNSKENQNKLVKINYSIKTCQKKHLKSKMGSFSQLFELKKKTNLIHIWNNKDLFNSFVDLYS